MRCIGIDIGSSSIKGGILNLESGLVEHTEKAAFPGQLPGLPAGFHEVDPQAVVLCTREVLCKLLQAAPATTQVRFTSQMGGILLLDAQHKPVTNYLSWRDQRSLLPAPGRSIPLIDQLRQAWNDQQFEELGKELKPGSATTLLCWLAQHQQLPRQTMPLTIGDYVIASICNAPPRMHRSHGIGMINLKTSDWHHDAFAAAGIDGLHWPPLATESETVGHFTNNGQQLECFAAIGDQQAALFGIDLSCSELSINCSTGSQVSQITAQFQPGNCQTRCWFDGQFLNTVTHIPAGRSLTVLESLLTELPRAAGISLTNSWQLIAEATEHSAANGLSCDLSFFSGAMGNQGRIENITTENLTVGSLFCAAFDFMADSYLECSHRLSSSPSWNQLAVSGGLVQAFPALRRRLAERFAWPMREVAEQEETLTGLLKLARRTAS
ncbi:MAG: sedoheptulokinase [Planctomyces sp.]